MSFIDLVRYVVDKSTKSDSIKTVTEQNVTAIVHRPCTISFLLLVVISFFTGCSRTRLATNNPVVRTTPGSESSSINNQLKDVKEFNRLYTTGALRAMQGDYTGAINYFRGALRALPNHSPSLEGIARCFAGLEQFDSALHYAREAASDDVSDPDVYRLLAELLVENKEYDSSAVVYERILASQPNDLQARFTVAKAREYSNPDNAVLHYTYIRNNIAEDFNSLVGLYQVYSSQRNSPGAASVLRALIVLNPDDPDLHDLHSSVWIDAERYDSALSALRLTTFYLSGKPRLLAQFLEPSLTLTELRLRSSYSPDSGLQRFADSLVQLAVHLMSEYPRPTYHAGMIALHRGAGALADSLLRRAFRAEELSAIAWTEAAKAYLERNLAERMLYTLVPSADRYDQKPEVSFRIAQGLEMANRPDDIQKYLEQAIAVDPEYGEAWQMLARLQTEKGDVGRAVHAFEQAISADPYNPSLLNEYARTLAESGTLLDKGQKLIERALELEPENELFLTTRGLIASLQKDYDAGVRYLQQAVDAGGATSELLELLGDAHRAMGDQPNALRAYNQALSVVGEDLNHKLRLQEKVNGIAP